MKEIVLIGGGHAHVHVMTALARARPASACVTLVSPEPETPYSGMLPGVIAGIYRREEAHLDLGRLSAATGTRFVQARATGLDRDARQVLLEGGGRLRYDFASFDVGAAPATGSIPGADAHAVPVKPIGRLLERLDALKARWMAGDGKVRIAVIGGGAGGVELVLSLREGLRTIAGQDPARLSFLLASAGPLLSTHNGRVRAAFRRILAEAGVALLEGQPVTAIEAGEVRFADGRSEAADAVLLATEAAAPTWFAGTGLALDDRGFLAVGPTLQSISNPDVLAAGDCATMVETPREKAGVIAVRAGPPLAQNLVLLAQGNEPHAWRPRRRHLALIGTGGRHAVASFGPLKAEGRWVWWLKEMIDRRWMARYRF